MSPVPTDISNNLSRNRVKRGVCLQLSLLTRRKSTVARYLDLEYLVPGGVLPAKQFADKF